MKIAKYKNLILIAIFLFSVQSGTAQIDSLFNKTDEVLPVANELLSIPAKELLSKIKADKKAKNASKKTKRDNKLTVNTDLKDPISSVAADNTGTNSKKKAKKTEEKVVETDPELGDEYKESEYEGLAEEQSEPVDSEVAEAVIVDSTESTYSQSTFENQTSEFNENDSSASTIPATSVPVLMSKNDSTRVNHPANAKETLWSLMKLGIHEIKTTVLNRYNQFESFVIDHFNGWKVRVILFILLYLFAYIYTKQTNRSLTIPEALRNNSTNAVLSPIMSIVSAGIVATITPFWFLFDISSQYIYPVLIRGYAFFRDHIFISGFAFFFRIIYHVVFRLFVALTSAIINVIPKLFRSDVMLISLLTMTSVYVLNYLPRVMVDDAKAGWSYYMINICQSASFIVLAIGVGILQIRYTSDSHKGFGNLIVWIGSHVLRVFIPALIVIALQAILLWIAIFTSVKWTLVPFTLILGYGLSVWGCINYFILLLLMPSLIGYLNGNQSFSFKGLLRYAIGLLPQYVVAIPIGIIFFSAVSIISNAVAFSSSELTVSVFARLQDKQLKNYAKDLLTSSEAYNTNSWSDIKTVNTDSLNKLFDRYERLITLDYQNFEFNRIYANTQTALMPILDKTDISTYRLYFSLWDRLKKSNMNQEITVSGRAFVYNHIESNVIANQNRINTVKASIDQLNSQLTRLTSQINNKQEELNSICEEIEEVKVKRKKEDAPLFERVELDKCDYLRERVSKELLTLKETRNSLQLKKDEKAKLKLREEAISKFLNQKNIEIRVGIASTKLKEKGLIAGLTVLIAIIYAIANLFFVSGFALTFAEINKYDWNPWRTKFNGYVAEVKKYDPRHPLMGISLAYLSFYVCSLMFNFEADDLLVRLFKATYGDLHSVYNQLIELIEQVKIGIVSIIKQ